MSTSNYNYFNIPSAVSCGFDNGLCPGWSQSTSDDFDWTLNSGRTSSSYTGPSSDLSGTGQLPMICSSVFRHCYEIVMPIITRLKLTNLTRNDRS